MKQIDVLQREIFPDHWMPNLPGTIERRRQRVHRKREALKWFRDFSDDRNIRPAGRRSCNIAQPTSRKLNCSRA